MYITWYNYILKLGFTLMHQMVALVMRYHPGNGFAALSGGIICFQFTEEWAGEGVAVVSH